jgi:hypothetical protein
MHTLQRAALAALLLAGSGCVSYLPREASVELAGASLAEGPDGLLAFSDAVRRLVARHPELQALRAEAAAVNLHPGPEPLEIGMEIMDWRASQALLSAELLSLFGIGPRDARRALARALKDERVLALHERARELVADLAEAFAVERALREQEPLALPLDVEAYEKAGLAPGAVLSAGRAALSEAEAENEILATRLAEARRRIVELVGARPGAQVEPADLPEPWPPLPDGDPQRLLYARGDLQRLFASYRVADHRYRTAIAEQAPGLHVGVGAHRGTTQEAGSLHGGPGAEHDVTLPMQMVALRLPIGAPAEARAAEHGREAAWHRLEAGVQRAMHDAESARNDLVAAEAMERGARDRRAAARALFEAETERVRTDPEALTALVFMAGEEVMAVRRLREASVEAARARAQAARAAGWPTAAYVKETR